MSKGIQKERADRILLGLAVSELSLHPGERRTHRDLAAFCDVSYQAIQKIERSALDKLKKRIGDIGFEWRGMFDGTTRTEQDISDRIANQVRLACDAWARRTGRGNFA